MAPAPCKAASPANQVSPVFLGTITVELEERSQAANVLGTTPKYFAIRNLKISSSTDLPAIGLDQCMRVAVIDRTVQRELFVRRIPGARSSASASFSFAWWACWSPRGGSWAWSSMT